jgi:hypothetical protein
MKLLIILTSVACAYLSATSSFAQEIVRLNSTSFLNAEVAYFKCADQGGQISVGTILVPKASAHTNKEKQLVSASIHMESGNNLEIAGSLENGSFQVIEVQKNGTRNNAASLALGSRQDIQVGASFHSCSLIKTTFKDAVLGKVAAN